jgi:hypothetical protein
MNSNPSSTIISAVIGAMLATAACFLYFNYLYKPGQTVDANGTATPLPSAIPSPIKEIPNPEIPAADITSIRIVTVYRGFFDAGHKCAKSYNEYFGNDDGIASPSSPCEISMEFGREGRATRTVELKRWDKAAKEKRLVEKAESTASVTSEQFDALAQAIASNEAFRSWREGTMINVSNCSITVMHTSGTKTVMSNVDEKAAVFLQMIDAIKNLEKLLNWRDGH